MHRRILYFFLILFIISSCRKPIDFNTQQQANADIIGEKCYGVSGVAGELSDDYKSICKTADNGFIICGTTSNLNLNSGEPTLLSDNFYFVKVNAVGEVEWERTYGW